LINRREGHAAAVRFLDAVASSPRLRVVQVAESLEATALTWLRSRDERECSFVDATSFAVMRVMGIDHAFAYDGDFAAAGFVELR
jgi:predicted nucleic acid-binding protein